MADSTQIHQIVMNLGTNAWQAMGDQPGCLEVILDRYVVDPDLAPKESRLKPGTYARLSVIDTGPGMDQGTLERIFEPFFTTKPSGEGTGLGLAVVYGIMQAHDGEITASSSIGKGTIFRLFFPEHNGAATATDANEDIVPRGHGERILLVDDEVLLAKMNRLTLTALGYEVEAATQPEEALATFAADPTRFALVLTDQTMPGMTGLALSIRIKQIQPRLPVILMTGNNISITPEKLSDAGIASVLLKPFELLALGTAVQKALESVTTRFASNEA